jgi:hypothetical protein
MKKLLFTLALALVCLAPLKAKTLALPAVDDCNTGPSSLSGNWTVITGSWSYLSFPPGGCLNAAAVEGMAAWTGDSFTSDQYSQVIADPSHYTGPCVRCSDGGGGTNNGYNIYAGAGDTGFYKWVAGTRSTLSGSWTNTLSGGEDFKLMATGTTTTTLEVFVNGVSKGSTTDSSSAITTGSPGMAAYQSGTYTFRGDNVGGGGGGSTFPPSLPNILIRCCQGKR